jgi:hypothetical protein
MKKSTFIAVLLGMSFAAGATTISAPSSMLGSDALQGAYAYSWGISIAVPNGQTVTSAEIDFTSVTLSAANSSGVGYLYTDLLNSRTIGAAPANDGDAPGDYWATKYSGNNITQVGTQFFPGVGTTLSWSYVLNATQLAALNSYLTSGTYNSGTFNIGIDPDCHYDVGGLSFTYDCSPTHNSVPDTTATAALLLFGLGALEVLRRQFVLAKAKA